MNTTATKQVEEFTAEAKKSMEEGVEQITKSAEDAMAFSQETVDAIVASGKIFAKATEEMNAEMISFSKKSYEDVMSASKEISTAKSVTELFEKQAAFAKSAFENYVSEATKINDLYAAAAKDAFGPLSARFTAATDMVKSYKA